MNLKVNSLKEENHTYRIFCTTSKLEGRDKKVSWITSKEIKKVINYNIFHCIFISSG